MVDNEITGEIEKTIEEVKEVRSLKDIKIDIKFDNKKTEEAIKTLKDAFSEAKKVVDKISSGIKNAMNSLAKSAKSAMGDVGQAITDAFTVTGAEEYTEAAERWGLAASKCPGSQEERSG